jgi:hypothetical protein
VSRTRIGLGLLAVAMGTAWATGGVRSLRVAVDLLVTVAPWLLLATGATMLFRAALPRGASVAPLVLIAAGGVVLAARFDAADDIRLGNMVPLILIAGGVTVAMSYHSGESEINTRVRRYTSVLFPVRKSLNGIAPDKIIVRAIPGMIDLDLSRADYPNAYRLVIDVTVFYGRIELTIADTWKVAAGRLDLIHRVHFSGEVSTADFADPIERPEDRESRLVVLNVQGSGGAVIVRRN